MLKCSSCNHITIPIFIPGMACPHRCIYCNQQVISGQQTLPTDEEIHHTVRTHLATMPTGSYVEVGFFGGTFTGLPMQEQQRLLQLLQPYRDRGDIAGIRCSTHPLFITPAIVDRVKRQGMTTIELGVQSMDDEVLCRSGRGYTSAQVVEAACTIREAGLHLGMQMMVGLPGDTADKSYYTAQCIVDCGADNTRIYPTLVVQHTALADLYRRGLYQALSVEEAVEWVRRPLRLFQERDITVLRVGLHPTEGFIRGTDYLAGPFHVSFKELVQTAIWRSLFEDYIATAAPSSAAMLTVSVSPRQFNSAIGYHAANKRYLLQHVDKVQFIADVTLRNYQNNISIS